MAHGKIAQQWLSRALLLAGTATALAGCSVENMGTQRPATPAFLRGLEGNTLSAEMLPSTLGLKWVSPAFNNYAEGRLNLHDASLAHFAAVLNNPGIQVSSLSLGQAATGDERELVTFSVKGVPLYHMSAVAHGLAGRNSFLLGHIPSVSPEAVMAAPTEFPDAGDAATVAAQNLEGSVGTVNVGSASRVYIVDHDFLRPAWSMRMKTGSGLAYRVVADDNKAFVSEQEFFTATGSAAVYPNSILDGKTTTYQLLDLAGDGTLTSPNLQTYPKGVAPANEPTEVFDFPASDPRFAEANAYAHTDDHIRWMLGLGGKTYGSLPIHLELHQLINNTTNNALFQPGDPSTGDPFLIELGDGDGQVLQNLATDWSVPSHESGHYIIYNYLKQTSGESLVLHEGMADTLVFLQENSPCLGKSICPAGSTACIEVGQCLRTADNSWAYNDANWAEWTAELGGNFGHKHGQVFSGLIWDLTKNNVMPLTDVTQLTMKAISYFQPSSGFRDFLLAVLTADRELFQCKYDAQIRTYMGARNLTTLISDVPAGCGSLPVLSGSGGSNAVDTGASSGGSGGTTSKSSGGKGGLSSLGCGITPDLDREQSPLLALFTLCLPLGLAAWGLSRNAQKRRGLVRAKARRNGRN